MLGHRYREMIFCSDAPILEQGGAWAHVLFRDSQKLCNCRAREDKVLKCHKSATFPGPIL